MWYFFSLKLKENNVEHFDDDFDFDSIIDDDDDDDDDEDYIISDTEEENINEEETNEESINYDDEFQTEEEGIVLQKALEFVDTMDETVKDIFGPLKDDDTDDEESKSRRRRRRRRRRRSIFRK